jgi:hypothetical protein
MNDNSLIRRIVAGSILMEIYIKSVQPQWHRILALVFQLKKSSEGRIEVGKGG